uniref:CRAL-TRIO domain-containing protein n=1 Tax=Plectus sambesii TaxID=2011161 RepID=A0A914XG33_9BILA
MDGFSTDMLWMPGVKLYLGLIRMLQDLFPDSIRKIYVIRAPSAVQVAYNMVHPILAKQTQQKVEFLGSDWKEKLQEVISPDVLFEHWGGTRSAPTPFGHIRMGGKVPKELHYNAKNNPEEPISKSLTTLSVPARSSQKVTVKVNKAGSPLKWFFRVTSGDISFSVVHSEGKVMRPALRLTTEWVPEWDELTCDLVGEYHLVFDNTHGKLWSKEIKYRLQVIAPKA